MKSEPLALAKTAPHVEENAALGGSRRRFLVNSAGLAAVVGLPVATLAAEAKSENFPASQVNKLQNTKEMKK